LVPRWGDQGRARGDESARRGDASPGGEVAGQKTLVIHVEFVNPTRCAGEPRTGAARDVARATDTQLVGMIDNGLFLGRTLEHDAA